MRGWAHRIPRAAVCALAVIAAMAAVATAEDLPDPEPALADESSRAGPEDEPADEPSEPVDLPPIAPQATAAEAAVAEAESTPKDWEPPEPSATEWDWLQMRSGEWLKGEFKTLRDYRVTFDSDEFDELDLDWKKVQAFYLARPHSYRVKGRVLLGTAQLRGKVLRVRTADGVQEFEKRDLDSVAQGTGNELDWWSLKVGLSFTLRQGNTSQVDLSGDGEIRRETAATRFIADYRGIFARTDGDKTANNHRVNTSYDVYLTRQLYWTIPFVDFFSDELQRIDARVTSGSALGYEFVRNEWVELDASLGLAHQYTRLDTDVEESPDSQDFGVVASTSIDFDLPGGTDWDNSYQVQLIATELGSTSHHGESELSVDVWGPMDLDVTFVWDRIESPANTDDDDDDPKKDDYRLMVGFSLDF